MAKLDTKSMESATNFLKGRIGEELVRQWFTRNDYAVLQIGIEHTNLLPLYNCLGHKWEPFFRRTRNFPDLCLVKGSHFRYVEVKFRNKLYSQNDDCYVLQTMLDAYYKFEFNSEYEFGYQGLSKNILMIWIYKNDVKVLKIGKAMDILNDNLSEINKDRKNPSKLLSILAKIQVPWNTDCFLYNNRSYNHKISNQDWLDFSADCICLLTNLI